MRQRERFKLLGNYRTPRFKVGDVVMDELRGEVKITGATDAKIPWPQGRCIGAKFERATPILYGDMIEAVKSESRQALCHWFDVKSGRVRQWRRLLGVGSHTAGTIAIRRAYCAEPTFQRARRKAWATADDPDRRAKASAARQGKKHPPHVIAAIAAAHVGK